MANNELDQLRQRVEELNLQLLSLINERARLYKKSAVLKKLRGLTVMIQYVNVICLI